MGEWKMYFIIYILLGQKQTNTTIQKFGKIFLNAYVQGCICIWYKNTYKI